MLSDIDIRRYLSKGIAFVPYDGKKIQSSSIDLTASKYAWTFENFHHASDTEKSYHLCSALSDDGKSIILRKNSRTIIFTDETIALSNKFSGYVNSRVSFAYKGVYSSCCPVKPNSIGRLIISLNNVSNNDINIRIGDEKGEKKGDNIALLSIEKLKRKSELESWIPNLKVKDLRVMGLQISMEEEDEIEAFINCGGAAYKMLNNQMKADDKYKEDSKKEQKRKYIREVVLPYILTHILPPIIVTVLTNVVVKLICGGK